MLIVTSGGEVRAAALEAASEAASETEGEEEGERKRDELRGMTRTHVVGATNRRGSSAFGP